MLRLTRVSENGSTVTLRVEGRIIWEWAEFLERECEALFNEFSVVRMDLAEVSYVDRNGVAALRRLRSRPLEIANTPPLIQQLLDQDGSQ
jgi:ABC-type transporter Mla MlaB component